jgi:hypothetical protein
MPCPGFVVDASPRVLDGADVGRGWVEGCILTERINRAGLAISTATDGSELTYDLQSQMVLIDMIEVESIPILDDGRVFFSRDCGVARLSLVNVDVLGIAFYYVHWCISLL